MLFPHSYPLRQVFEQSLFLFFRGGAIYLCLLILHLPRRGLTRHPTVPHKLSSEKLTNR